MHPDYDALVIGGGPAGAWTARGLALQGWRVVLWDRAAFPRDKPCGEYVSPGAMALLHANGAGAALAGLNGADVTGARIFTKDGGSFEGGFLEGDGKGRSFRRTRLDAALLGLAQDAGVEVRQGVSFQRFTVKDGVATAHGRANGEETALRCRVVAGADGSHSAVARQMGVVKPIKHLQKLALVTHARGIAGMGSQVEMHTGPDGCVGLGPGADGQTNVTLVVKPSQARVIAPDAGGYIRAAINRFPGLRGRFDDAEWDAGVLRVGTFGHTARQATANGALLVGDAATFVDPFTGEGVYFALRGAEMAAARADTALRQGAVTAASLAAYDRDRRAEFAAKYLLCGLIQRVVHTPWALHLIAERLRAAPMLADDMIRATGDILRPDRIFSPAYWSRLLA